MPASLYRLHPGPPPTSFPPQKRYASSFDHLFWLRPLWSSSILPPFLPMLDAYEVLFFPHPFFSLGVQRVLALFVFSFFPPLSPCHAMVLPLFTQAWQTILFHFSLHFLLTFFFALCHSGQCINLLWEQTAPFFLSPDERSEFPCNAGYGSFCFGLISRTRCRRDISRFLSPPPPSAPFLPHSFLRRKNAAGSLSFPLVWFFLEERTAAEVSFSRVRTNGPFFCPFHRPILSRLV